MLLLSPSLLLESLLPVDEEGGGIVTWKGRVKSHFKQHLITQDHYRNSSDSGF